MFTIKSWIGTYSANSASGPRQANRATDPDSSSERHSGANVTASTNQSQADHNDNDDVSRLRSAYGALIRLQSDVDNLEACLKSGDVRATTHLASAKANVTEALQQVTKLGKPKTE